ncbi:MAG: hypothetical protein ABIG63_02235 [Chloroflexota bacterium]
MITHCTASLWDSDTHRGTGCDRGGGGVDPAARISGILHRCARFDGVAVAIRQGNLHTQHACPATNGSIEGPVLSLSKDRSHAGHNDDFIPDIAGVGRKIDFVHRGGVEKVGRRLSAFSNCHQHLLV